MDINLATYLHSRVKYPLTQWDFGWKLDVLHTTPSMLGLNKELYIMIHYGSNQLSHFGMPRSVETSFDLNEPKHVAFHKEFKDYLQLKINT